MSCLGNILWLICGGFASGLSWFFVGLLWCITIIGIPIGSQCFKFASVSFCPFGKKIVWEGGAGSFLMNVIWFFLGGVEMALLNAALGIVCCVTIIGIPFGLQYFKIAKLSLMPVGARVIG